MAKEVGPPWWSRWLRWGVVVMLVLDVLLIAWAFKHVSSRPPTDAKSAGLARGARVSNDGGRSWQAP